MDRAQLQADRAELQAFADRFVDTLKRRDPKALSEFHAANGVAESPMYATRVGRQSIEGAYRSFVTSFPDMTVAVEHLLVDPPHIALFATVDATHVNEFFGLPGTNRHIEFRIAWLFAVENGLIARDHRVYDFTGILLQVVLLRAKPAKP
jgi:predicted ester cyclase